MGRFVLLKRLRRLLNDAANGAAKHRVRHSVCFARPGCVRRTFVRRIILHLVHEPRMQPQIVLVRKHFLANAALFRHMEFQSMSLLGNDQTNQYQALRNFLWSFRAFECPILMKYSRTIQIP